MNLHQEGSRALAHVAQQNGVLANDGNDALGDRGAGKRREESEQESSNAD
jgi:hypothetical protein